MLLKVIKFQIFKQKKTVEHTKTILTKFYDLSIFQFQKNNGELQNYKKNRKGLDCIYS